MGSHAAELSKDTSRRDDRLEDKTKQEGPGLRPETHLNRMIWVGPIRLYMVYHAQGAAKWKKGCTHGQESGIAHDNAFLHDKVSYTT